MDKKQDFKQLLEKLQLDSNLLNHCLLIHKNSKFREESWFVAACVYSVCKITNTPLTLIEVAEATGLKRKDIAKGYRQIINLKANGTQNTRFVYK